MNDVARLSYRTVKNRLHETGLKARQHVQKSQIHHAIFQKDNTRPHVACVTMNHLRQHNVTVLPWSSNSRDLSPIEHIWDILARRVQNRIITPCNLDMLFNALVEE